MSVMSKRNFRHIGATMLRRDGMDIEDVSTLLNYESISTTINII